MNTVMKIHGPENGENSFANTKTLLTSRGEFCSMYLISYSSK